MTSRLRRDDPAVIIVDDSDSDQHSARRNRKPKSESPEILDKVQWSDESDVPSAPAKPQKRRARASTGGTSNSTKKRKTETTRRKRRSGLSTSAANDDDASTDDEGRDELELADIPEYVQERRRAFDAARQEKHEAALMLPPDYTGIEFDETGHLGDLEERPQFDEASGIRPCRAYQDIELPQSGGLIPASIARYLRDYQVDGVRFLHRKFVYQEGGILGDDMGLGKTVQVAAFMAAAFGKTGDERDAKRLRRIRYRGDRWYPRVLIICPGSLIMNWRAELTRWGWWHVDVFHGAGKNDVLDTARAGLLEVMITTYDTYKNSRSSINMVAWDAVIADECHRIKDRASETTRALAEVNALCRLGLTGTAIQNRYEELWTLLDWTNPGHFGTLAEWRDTVAKPLAIGQSHEATLAQLSLARQTARKLVHNLLPRYFLRRMKTLIAHQLPRKTDRVVFCPLTDLQRGAYERFLASDEIHLLRTVSDECEHGNAKGWCCRRFLRDGRSWQSVVFPSMMVLQKLANHVTLLVPQTTDLARKQETELRTLQTCVPSSWRELYAGRDQIRSLVEPEFYGKWKVLRKLLRFWHASRDKVLVFSHSVRLLRILQHLFHSTSYNVSYLDGSLGYEARQAVVDRFNTDPAQFVFLISTRAGGVGLNITSANKVVIVDPHWNPSYDLQAQDRAYRIGQTRDVDVFRLISLGTVEEVVYARQIYKQQQANIGYTASSERRYFRGVQQDTDRKGEIFGLANIFTYHPDSGLLRDIVNKTNVAEARAGVGLADVDMEQAAQEHDTPDNNPAIKSEDADGGVGQLADILVKSEEATGKQKETAAPAAAAPKTDAIQAILASAGVEYTHENADVVGSSKVEEQLSRRAAALGTTVDEMDMLPPDALFGAAEGTGPGPGAATAAAAAAARAALHTVFNPPADVQLRQFCDMAREFGFGSATDFALVVESWSSEDRRRCLDEFYRRRKRAVGGRAGEPRLDGPGLDGWSGSVKMEDVPLWEGDAGQKHGQNEDRPVKHERHEPMANEAKHEPGPVKSEHVKHEHEPRIVKNEVKHEPRPVKTEASLVKNEHEPKMAKSEVKHEHEQRPVKHEKDKHDIDIDAKHHHTAEAPKREDAEIKQEKVKTEPHEAKEIKSEDDKKERLPEMAGKRISIFLSDDDEDDEL